MSVPLNFESSLALRKPSNAEKRVLVVEDNQVIADTMAMVLRSAGFHAVAALGGRHALALLQCGSFDLLLSDVMMPEVSGVELAIEATKSRYVGKVLLMSGVSATADLLSKARKRGYTFEILAKPTHPTEVIDRIRCLLDIAVKGRSEDSGLHPNI